MKSQTSLVAEQFRLQQWAEQIRSCQNRPHGMKVTTWCDQNGITRANYYYRLQRVREACLTAVEDVSPSFIELPVPTDAEKVEDKELTTAGAATIATAAVLRTPGGFSLEISALASAEFIRSVIGAMAYVK